MQFDLRNLRGPALGLVAWICVACSGGTGRVRFEGLQYPASMSPVLRLEHERVPLEVVGKFEVVGRSWSTFYRLLSFNPEVDLSPEINAEIERAGGTAAINLAIEVGGCGINAVFALNWLPIWPSCTIVTIRGDIVKQT